MRLPPAEVYAEDSLGPHALAVTATGNLARAVAMLEDLGTSSELYAVGDGLGSAGTHADVGLTTSGPQQLAALCAGVPTVPVSAEVYAAEGCAMVAQLATERPSVETYEFMDPALDVGRAATWLLKAAGAAMPQQHAALGEAADDLLTSFGTAHDEHYLPGLAAVQQECGEV